MLEGPTEALGQDPRGKSSCGSGGSRIHVRLEGKEAQLAMENAAASQLELEAAAAARHGRARQLLEEQQADELRREEEEEHLEAQDWIA